MRVLVALGGNPPLRRGERAAAKARRREVELAAAGLAAIAARHELVIARGAGGGWGGGGGLEVALRNALPDRDLITVGTEVVVGAPPEPRAIVGLRGLRVLIEAGILVVCVDCGTPVAVQGDGTMRGVDAAIDGDLTASLLARRLEADLLVMLTGAGALGSKVEAAHRFAEATGRRAAIGALEDAVAVVAGTAGTQVSRRA